MSGVAFGELLNKFSDAIPLHEASRIWLHGTKNGKLSNADKMRQCALLKCIRHYKVAFDTTRVTRATIVRIVPTTCASCGRVFIARVHTTKVCGRHCALVKSGASMAHLRHIYGIAKAMADA